MRGVERVYLPSAKQSVISFVLEANARPHSASNSSLDSDNVMVGSDGAIGRDFRLLTRARKERMAGTAMGGGDIGRGREYHVIVVAGSNSWDGECSSQGMIVSLYCGN